MYSDYWFYMDGYIAHSIRFQDHHVNEISDSEEWLFFLNCFCLNEASDSS